MSIALMTAAWRINLPSNHKLAMLALCDWANDSGDSLHPSMRAIAQRVGVSERQAQRIVHSLIDGGWIAVVGNINGGAPGASRQYRINVEKLTQTGDANGTRKCASLGAKDRQTGVAGVTGDMGDTGDMDDARRVTPVTQTGDTGDTQTTIEPSIEPSLENNTARGAREGPARLDRPSDVPEPLWSDFLAVRRAAKAPLTATALAGIRREAAKAGMSIEDVLSLCCERGWRGFNAGWVAGAASPSKRTAAPDKHGGFSERAYVGTDPKSIEWA